MLMPSMFQVKIALPFPPWPLCNASSLCDAAYVGIDFYAFDVFQVKIALGSGVTRGLGAGGKPEVGQAAAKESLPDIEKVLAGADMVFVTAGKSTVRGSVGNTLPSFFCRRFLFCALEGVCVTFRRKCSSGGL